MYTLAALEWPIWLECLSATKCDMGSSPPKLEKISESEDRAVEAHKSVNHPGFKTQGRCH